MTRRAASPADGRRLRSGLALCLLATGALLAAGCLDRHDEMTPDECDLIAWYLEDVAHGRPRQPAELQLVSCTASFADVAAWARGGVALGQALPPAVIARRRQRDGALRGLFREHLAGVLDNGLVAPRPGLPRADAAYADRCCDAEDADRRSVDAVVISLGHLGPRIGRRYLAASAAARVALDQEDGASRVAAGEGSRPGR